MITSRKIQFVWDKYLKFSTIIGFIVWLFLGGWIFEKFFEIFSKNPELRAPCCLIFGFWVFVIVQILRYSPRYLVVDREGVTLKTWLRSVRIDRHEILVCRPLHYRELRHGVGMMSSRGLGGEVGIYKNDELGRHYRYITSREDLLYIETREHKYIISCAEMDWVVELASKEWLLDGTQK